MKKNLNLTEDFSYPTEQDWKAAAEKLLKGRPFDKTLFTSTEEGITLKPIYFPDLSFNPGNPGEFPFVRGMKKKPAENDSWFVCQTLFTANDSFNKTAQDALQKGQTALNIDLDLVSQYADSAPVIPGRLGNVHIRDKSALNRLFERIDLENVPLFFDALCRAADLHRFLMEFISEKGFAADKVRIGLGADPLTAALKYGGFPEKPEKLIDDISTLFESPAGRLDVITISAEYLHNCGANKIQELSYILSSAIYYINALQEYGLNPEQIISKIRVKLAIGSDQFMEIAKIRALRALWGNLCRAYAPDNDQINLKIDAVTSWRSMSYYDPWSNMLRATGQAFTAICGGVDTLDVLPFDLPLGAPDDFSRRIARNVPLILKAESNLARIIDPGAGSGVIESLTTDLSEKSWQAFQEIEEKGGILSRIESGEYQENIAENAQNQLDNFNTLKHKQVGTNFYANLIEKRPAKSQTRVPFKNMKKSANWPVKFLGEKRLSEHFEKIRQVVEKQAAIPKLLLIQFGELKDYIARSDFARGFFETAGFEIIEQKINDEHAIEILTVPLCVLCSSDSKYDDRAISLAKELKEKHPSVYTVLAGNPGDKEKEYRKSGIDDFIHLKSNRYEKLSYIIKEVYKI